MSRRAAAAKGDPSSRRQVYVICLLLAVATLAVYWQVGHFELVNYDDDLCVEQNPIVNAGLCPAGIGKAFSTPYTANWIPLVWISYMVDHDFGSSVYGLDPAGAYHATNLLLHLANVILLFLLLVALTGSRWKSAFVAALFAVHPLHVESVAWVTERKDVLSTLFWILTMLAYLRYAARPSARRYALVVLAFALGLMSKSMLVTLPIVLILLDYWPLGRIGSDGRSIWTGLRAMAFEKLPLLVLTGVMCVVTIWAQSSGGRWQTSVPCRSVSGLPTHWWYILPTLARCSGRATSYCSTLIRPTRCRPGRCLARGRCSLD